MSMIIVMCKKLLDYQDLDESITLLRVHQDKITIQTQAKESDKKNRSLL